MRKDKVNLEKLKLAIKRN